MGEKEGVEEGKRGEEVIEVGVVEGIERDIAVVITLAVLEVAVGVVVVVDEEAEGEVEKETMIEIGTGMVIEVEVEKLIDLTLYAQTLPQTPLPHHPLLHVHLVPTPH